LSTIPDSDAIKFDKKLNTPSTLKSSLNCAYPSPIIGYTARNIANNMIRLIILFAIFLAVYPMIGDGYAQFSEDFNVDGVFSFLSNLIASLSGMVDKLQG
jgi:hypothetical protein